MKQGTLHSILMNMLEKDTGSNYHAITARCTVKDVRHAKRIIIEKRGRGFLRGRQFKVIRLKDTCQIQIYRPLPAPTNEYYI